MNKSKLQSLYKEAPKFKFEIGDKVFKPKGYKFNSTIVAVFLTTAGEIRLVAENKEKLLHIFNEQQLEHWSERGKYPQNS